MGKQSQNSKTSAKSFCKEVALPAKGGNSTAVKEKNLMTCQERNRQRKQADKVNAPMKPPPARADILDLARAAAREQLKADREQQAQNAEWRRLHVKGSLGAFTHHSDQNRTDKSNAMRDNTSNASELREDKTAIMQTKEIDKHKAWGSLCTPTNEAALTSPVKKKAKADTMATDKSDGSELSEEETEKMQTNKLDKRKAWRSLQTSTKEADTESPQKEKSEIRQDSQSTNPTYGRFLSYYR